MRVHRVTALVRTAASAGDGSVLANGRLRLGAMPASSTKWPKRPSKREAWPSVGGTSRPLPGGGGRLDGTSGPPIPRSRTPPVKRDRGCAGRGGAGPPRSAGPAVLSPRGRPLPPASPCARRRWTEIESNLMRRISMQSRVSAQTSEGERGSGWPGAVSDGGVALSASETQDPVHPGARAVEEDPVRS
jgi:hypothetical protein